MAIGVFGEFPDISIEEILVVAPPPFLVVGSYKLDLTSKKLIV